MSRERPRLSQRSEAVSTPGASSKPAGRAASAEIARVLFANFHGNVPWHRVSLSIAVTVLLTGIGLSCVLANVLDGHPIIFAVP